MTIFKNRTRIGAAVLSVALLAACGGGDKNDEAAAASEEDNTEIVEVEADAGEVKVDVAPSTQKLIDLCLEDGGTEQICGCTIQAMEDAIGAEELATVAELAEEDADAASLYVEDIIGNKLEVATKMSTSVNECMGG